MQTMTWGNTLALLGAMLILAAIPSFSVFTIVVSMGIFLIAKN